MLSRLAVIGVFLLVAGNAALGRQAQAALVCLVYITYVVGKLHIYMEEQ